MPTHATTLETRLQAVEDRLAIYQTICGYGYSVDGCNAESVGACYVEDGVYAVGDIGEYVGRERIAAITRDDSHLALVNAGCAHVSTLPYVVIDGDHAAATCHTMVLSNGADGFFIHRLSASRLQLARQTDGSWKIVHRQNYMLNGDAAGPQLLARLKEGPQVAF